MNRTSATRAFHLTALLALVPFAAADALAADEMPNACPTKGCEVKIVDVKKAGKELVLTLKANYKPDMSKNHIHVWWGELYTIKQVSDNAEPVYKVKQGDWHPTDEYPTYTTQGPASVAERGKAQTICVSPADRSHNILDVKVMHCVKVADKL